MVMAGELHRLGCCQGLPGKRTGQVGFDPGPMSTTMARWMFGIFLCLPKVGPRGEVPMMQLAA